MNLEGPDYRFTLVSLSGSHFFDVLKYYENFDLHKIPRLLDASYQGFGGEGIRVLIHPPNSKPYPSSDGMIFVFHLYFSYGLSVKLSLSGMFNVNKLN